MLDDAVSARENAEGRRGAHLERYKLMSPRRGGVGRCRNGSFGGIDIKVVGFPWAVVVRVARWWG